MTDQVIIGDVHGCIDEFEELLDVVDNGHRPILCLGDFMDRGPDSVACVRLARKRGLDSIKGNHDEKHVRYRRHERTRGKKKNPVGHIDHALNAALSDEDLAWLDALPLSWDLGNGWHAVHGGLETNRTFDEQKDCESVLRTRFINDDGTAWSPTGEYVKDPADRPFWAERWLGPENIVYGHHIHKFLGPTIHARGGAWGGVRNTCVGIDTGCYAGGRLTAMILRSDGTYCFEHVDAKRVYEPLSDRNLVVHEPVARARGL